MLLELDVEEMRALADDPVELKSKVTEAVRVLEDFESQTDAAEATASESPGAFTEVVAVADGYHFVDADGTDHCCFFASLLGSAELRKIVCALPDLPVETNKEIGMHAQRPKEGTTTNPDSQQQTTLMVRAYFYNVSKQGDSRQMEAELNPESLAFISEDTIKFILKHLDVGIRVCTIIRGQITAGSMYTLNWDAQHNTSFILGQVCSLDEEGSLTQHFARVIRLCSDDVASPEMVNSASVGKGHGSAVTTLAVEPLSKSVMKNWMKKERKQRALLSQSTAVVIPSSSLLPDGPDGAIVAVEGDALNDAKAEVDETENESNDKQAFKSKQAFAQKLKALTIDGVHTRPGTRSRLLNTEKTYAHC